MKERSGVSVSVKLPMCAEDELYWGLVKPLQTSRSLTDFLLTLLRAYLHDDEVHERVDNYAQQNNGVAQIKSHIQSLIDLHAKANRYADDLSQTLGNESATPIVPNFSDSGMNDNGVGALPVIPTTTSTGVGTPLPQFSQGNVDVSHLLSEVLSRLTGLEEEVKQIRNGGTTSPNSETLEQTVSNIQKVKDIEFTSVTDVSDLSSTVEQVGNKVETVENSVSAVEGVESVENSEAESDLLSFMGSMSF